MTRRDEENNGWIIETKKETRTEREKGIERKREGIKSGRVRTRK